MQEQVADPEKLKNVKNFIAKMPSLSTTVTKVLQICNDPMTSPNDLNKVISLDPVLTGNVLKLINSAYYSIPNQVTSLTRAIIMLGINTVKNLALSTAVMGTIGDKISDNFSIDDFWAHSIKVGVTAKALAAELQIPAQAREEFFVAGLLHDLGKVPITGCFGEEYVKILELLTISPGPVAQAEKAVLGLDHCDVGKMIAEKWKLSPGVIETLFFHHAPEKAAEDNQFMVNLVGLANQYAHYLEKMQDDDIFINVDEFKRLSKKSGISVKALSGLKDTILAEIENANVFLQVSQ